MIINIECSKKFFFLGIYIVVIVNGVEKYEMIVESCVDVFWDVNEVIEDGYIIIEEEKVLVEIFFFGDCKVIKLFIIYILDIVRKIIFFYIWWLKGNIL